jgi:hypothetical protein
MAHIRDRRIFMRAASVLNLYGSEITPTYQFLAAEALALLADTEDFVTNKTAYVTSREEVDELVMLKETLLQSLMTDLDKRKVIRPLMDSIDKLKRQMKK